MFKRRIQKIIKLEFVVQFFKSKISKSMELSVNFDYLKEL